MEKIYYLTLYSEPTTFGLSQILLQEYNDGIHLVFHQSSSYDLILLNCIITFNTSLKFRFFFYLHQTEIIAEFPRKKRALAEHHG